MSRRDVDRLKAQFRDQCFLDKELTASAFKLAYGLADYATLDASLEKYRLKKKLIVWPSQEALRQKTNLSLDTITVGVAQLIERGHLKRLKRGNQFRGSNKYRLLVRNAAANAEST